MTGHRQFWRRAILLPAVAGVFLFAASCDGFFVSTNSIQSVTVSPPGALLQAGANPLDTVSLTANAKTVGGSTKSPDPNATWSTSDSSVATVDTQGVVTAATSDACKTATITAKDGASGSATVITYTGTIPSTVTVSAPNNTTSVAPGAAFKVIATVNLSCNSTQPVSNLVTWTLSTNSAGATIDSQGNVTVPATAAALSTFTVNAAVQLGKAAGNTTQASGSLSFTVS